MRYLKTKGAPNSKIIMGIPTYGQTFTLSSAQTGVGAPASGPGLAGTFTKTAGTLAYYEVKIILVFFLLAPKRGIMATYFFCSIPLILPSSPSLHL